MAGSGPARDPAAELARIANAWNDVERGFRHDPQAALRELAASPDSATLSSIASNAFGDIPSSLRFGAYRIEGLIGVGGMGTVFRATDTRTGEHVALKTLRHDKAHDDTLRERLVQEAETLRRVQHRGICKIRDFDFADGVPFVVLDLVTGRSLADILQEFRAPTQLTEPGRQDSTKHGARTRRRLPSGCVPWRTLAALIADVARTMQHAHEQDIVHRDLKPANILVDPRGKPTILDFGIAKSLARDDDPGLTGDRILGTDLYMAPEQRQRGGTIDARTDVYALGVILYECLTLTTPDPSQPDRTESADVLDPDVPSGLARIAERAMQQAADARFGSAMELANAIDRELARTHESGPRIARRTFWIALAACLPLAFAIGFWMQRDVVRSYATTRAWKTPLSEAIESATREMWFVGVHFQKTFSDWKRVLEDKLRGGTSIHATILDPDLPEDRFRSIASLYSQTPASLRAEIVANLADIEAIERRLSDDPEAQRRLHVRLIQYRPAELLYLFDCESATPRAFLGSREIDTDTPDAPGFESEDARLIRHWKSVARDWFVDDSKGRMR
ncbi:MAG: protein kinase [Planctomycetes bacterium]|nr:protein kinase [Planctomycetota bacterium]